MRQQGSGEIPLKGQKFLWSQILNTLPMAQSHEFAAFEEFDSHNVSHSSLYKATVASTGVRETLVHAYIGKLEPCGQILMQATGSTTGAPETSLWFHTLILHF